jgi:hypothetical protein
MLPKHGPVACPAMALITVKPVVLKEPIGARDLFDGSTKSPRMVWDNPASP